MWNSKTFEGQAIIKSSIFTKNCLKNILVKILHLMIAYPSNVFESHIFTLVFMFTSTLLEFRPLMPWQTWFRREGQLN